MASSMASEETNGALSIGSRVHIADLNSDHPNIDAHYIEGTVRLVWPYSSSTGELSFLLAERDVILRKAKGQVKVTFHHACAKEVARSRAGIGDTVRIVLSHVDIEKDNNTISTPGKKAGFTLHFREAIRLEISVQNGRTQSIDFVVPQLLQDSPSGMVAEFRTPATNGTLDISETRVITASTPVIRAGSRLSSNSFPGSFMDPFAEEDGYVHGRGRKRTKFARHSGAWRFVDDADNVTERLSQASAEATEHLTSANAIKGLFEPLTGPDATVVDLILGSSSPLETTQAESPIVPTSVPSSPTPTEKIIPIGDKSSSPTAGSPASSAPIEDKFSTPLLSQAPPSIQIPVDAESLERSELVPTPVLRGTPPPGLESPLVSREQHFSGVRWPMSELDASALQGDPASVWAQIQAGQTVNSNVQGAAATSQQLQAEPFPSRTESRLSPYQDPGAPPPVEIDLDALQREIDARHAEFDNHIRDSQSDLVEDEDMYGASPYPEMSTQPPELAQAHRCSPLDDERTPQNSEVLTQESQAKGIYPVLEQISESQVSNPAVENRWVQFELQGQIPSSERGQQDPHSTSPAAHVDRLEQEFNQIQRSQFLDGVSDGIFESITMPVPKDTSTVDLLDPGTLVGHVENMSEQLAADLKANVPLDEDMADPHPVDFASPRASHAILDHTATVREEVIVLDSDDESDVSATSSIRTERIESEPDEPEFVGEESAEEVIGTFMQPAQPGIAPPVQDHSEAESVRSAPHAVQLGDTKSTDSADEEMSEAAVLSVQRDAAEAVDDGFDEEVADVSEQPVSFDHTLSSPGDPTVSFVKSSPQGVRLGDAESVQEISDKEIGEDFVPPASLDIAESAHDFPVEYVVQSPTQFNKQDDLEMVQPFVDEEPVQDIDEGETVEAAVDSEELNVASAASDGTESTLEHSTEEVVETLPPTSLSDVAPMASQDLHIPQATQLTAEAQQDQVNVYPGATMMPLTPMESQEHTLARSFNGVNEEVREEPNAIASTSTDTSTHQRSSRRLLVRPARPEGLSSDYFTPSKAPVRLEIAKPTTTHVSSPALENQAWENLAATAALISPSSRAGQASAAKLDTTASDVPEGAAHGNDEEASRAHLARGITTEVSYYAPLVRLQEYYDSQVDILALCTADSSAPARAKAGPQDFHTTLHLADNSFSHKSLTTITAQIFRPRKSALPSVKRGNVVLLRNFKVHTKAHKPFLLSTDESAWAVFATQDFLAVHNEMMELADQMTVVVSGPPIEYGAKERHSALQHFQWWSEEGQQRHKNISTAPASSLKANLTIKVPPAQSELRRSPRKLGRDQESAASPTSQTFTARSPVASFDGTYYDESPGPPQGPVDKGKGKASVRPSPPASVRTPPLNKPHAHFDNPEQEPSQRATTPAHAPAPHHPASSFRNVSSTLFPTHASVSTDADASTATSARRRRRHERRSTSVIHELRDGTQWVDVEDVEIVSASESDEHSADEREVEGGVEGYYTVKGDTESPDPIALAEHGDEAHAVDEVDEMDDGEGHEDENEDEADTQLHSSLQSSILNTTASLPPASSTIAQAASLPNSQPTTPVTATAPTTGTPTPNKRGRGRPSKNSANAAQTSPITAWTTTEAGQRSPEMEAGGRVTRSQATKEKEKDGNENVHELRDGMRYTD